MGTVQKSVRLLEDLVGTVRAWAGERGAAGACGAARASSLGTAPPAGGQGLPAPASSPPEDFGRLRAAYHWLSEAQLRAALGYYAAYPQEVDRLIGRNAAWTPERLRAGYPGRVGRPDR